MRALGKAWAEADGNGGFQLKRGRPPEGALTEAQAAEKMLGIVREHHEEQALLERDAQERRRRGVTFREVACAYLAWMEEVKGAKPSTMRNHRSLLAEPGQPYRRGRGTTEGRIMRVLGDRPAQAVTTREYRAGPRRDRADRRVAEHREQGSFRDLGGVQLRDAAKHISDSAATRLSTRTGAPSPTPLHLAFY